MGRHPESRSESEDRPRWLKVKITDFRLGDGNSADQVCAKFLGLASSHSEWFSTDTDEVVPAHDPEYTWDAQEGNNSCFHRIKSNREDKEPPTEATDKTQVAVEAVESSVDATTEDLLRDHYYRVEITGFESDAVTLSWYYPPANPRDSSSWIGLYPLRDEPPEVPPSATLMSNRAAFKYITKNNSSGEVRFRVNAALKSKQCDEKYFFALYSHSVATLLATSPMVCVKDGEVVSVETHGGQNSPHDGIDAARIGNRGSRRPVPPSRSVTNGSGEPAVSAGAVESCQEELAAPLAESREQATRVPQAASPEQEDSKADGKVPKDVSKTDSTVPKEDSKADSTVPKEEESVQEAPEELEERSAQNPTKAEPSEADSRQVGNGRQQKAQVAQSLSDANIKALANYESSEVPRLASMTIREPRVDEIDDQGKSWYQVRVREANGTSVSINWAFPPGNPSDSSAYVSLYPLCEWGQIDLPYSRPNLSVFGYKYITQNGMHGVFNFTFNSHTGNNQTKSGTKSGNPMRDGLYVFALHCQDVVQALSQPVQVANLQVTSIRPHTEMRRCSHTPITSRNRQRTKPPAAPVADPSSAPGATPIRDRKKRKRTEPRVAKDVNAAASDALLAVCKANKTGKSNHMKPAAEVQMKHIPLKKKGSKVAAQGTKVTAQGTKVTAQAAPPKKRVLINDILQCAEELEQQSQQEAQASWMFNCQCGLSGKEVDDGTAMVQCDKCSKWQHASCVGVQPDDLAESKYLCWMCESRVPLKHRKRKLANDFQPAAVVEEEPRETAEQKVAALLSGGNQAGNKGSGVHRAAFGLLRGMPSEGYGSLSRNLLEQGSARAAGLVHMNLGKEEPVPWSRRLDQLQQQSRSTGVKPYELQSVYPGNYSGNYAWCNPERSPYPVMDRPSPTNAASEMGRGAQAMWEMRNMGIPHHGGDGGGMHHLAAQQMGYCVQPYGLQSDAGVIQTQPYQYPHGWMDFQNGNPGPQHHG